MLPQISRVMKIVPSWPLSSVMQLFLHMKLRALTPVLSKIASYLGAVRSFTNAM